MGFAFVLATGFLRPFYPFHGWLYCLLKTGGRTPPFAGRISKGEKKKEKGVSR